MRLKNLSMSYGTQEIFNEINLYINENEKVGVVGVNGSGKTTLFKIIMGINSPDEGEVILENNKRVEWLPQIIDEDLDNKDITVLDFLLLSRPIAKLTKELEKLYEEIANSSEAETQAILFKKVDNIQKKLDYWEYYSAESSLLKIISGMNIPSDLLDQKLNTLSGGQKSKIAFAKLLYSKPELILLDEPTNHLDKESKEYVTNYLKNYKGSVLIISHDIEFLNQVTTKTLFIDKRTKRIEIYNGNYNRFKELNQEYEKALFNQAQIQEQETKKLQDFINKYSSSSGKRKKMVLDREKKLEKLLEEKITLPQIQKNVQIKMEQARESSNIPLKVRNVSFKYDKNNEKEIINNLTFELSKGEKFLIVGENGIGKSTLLKLIIGQLKPDEGTIEIGNKTDIGYYAQEHELLENEKTIIENLQNINISIKKIRSVLSRFLFYDDDVFKQVKILSPGERSRVALAKLSLEGTNFLILDEPTNHLDPETQAIIAETFKTFRGTMLVVSHNKEFVSNLGIKRTLVLPSGEISYYDEKIVDYYYKLNQKKNSKIQTQK